MAKDPAFLFYPGNAADDTQFMNRLERGCYFDILKAQKRHRKFTLELIKKVLGRDFEQCWPAIECVLKKDGEVYFIEWVDDAIENRAIHAAKQKKRIQDWWDKKRKEEADKLNQINSTEQPPNESGITLKNEIASTNENTIEDENSFGKSENLFLGTRPSKQEVFENIFNDEFFVIHLNNTHPGKDFKKGFDQCWMYHTQKPSPPWHAWEWRQKLLTWLDVDRGNEFQSKSKTQAPKLSFEELNR